MSTVASASRPPPPRHPLPRPAAHALAAARPPPRLRLISILTVTVRVGGAAGGAQDPRRWRRASRTCRGGGFGGPGRAISRSGLRVFFLSFLFSLCLLQDLKGQPRPRRGARWPPFLRSPDALCGPAGPAGTRSTGSRPPGIFRFTPGPGQRGGGAWLGRSGARLFLQSPIGGGNKTTQQLLSHPKVGNKEWGREVSQMLSEFQRAQKDTSPTRETTGLQHSRDPNPCGQSAYRPLGRGPDFTGGSPRQPSPCAPGTRPEPPPVSLQDRQEGGVPEHPVTRLRSQGAGPRRVWLRPAPPRPRPADTLRAPEYPWNALRGAATD